LDFEIAFHATWNSGLLNKLSAVKISTSFIKGLVSFLTKRRCMVSVEGDFLHPEK
jgi:hypothetical protein